MTNEVIVHIAKLETFFEKAFSQLVDGGAMVNKELHFTHPGFGRELNSSLAFSNELYGGTGNYRALADELALATDAGFAVEEVRQIHRKNYYLTVSGWLANLRRHREELTALVGEKVYKDFLTYLSLTVVDFGDKASPYPRQQLHIVKCRKLPEALRASYHIEKS
jgi:cyclopropane fatty-acyl-phospholipid synthase-like methyltransferase